MCWRQIATESFGPDSRGSSRYRNGVRGGMVLWGRCCDGRIVDRTLRRFDSESSLFAGHLPSPGVGPLRVARRNSGRLGMPDHQELTADPLDSTRFVEPTLQRSKRRSLRNRIDLGSSPPIQVPAFPPLIRQQQPSTFGFRDVELTLFGIGRRRAQ